MRGIKYFEGEGDGRLPSLPKKAIGAAFWQSLTSPPAAFAMADPATILMVLKGLAVATTTVYHATTRALELEHEEQQALKDLSRAVEGVKSDTAVYETLLKAMENDKHPDSNSSSPYARFIQRCVTGLS